MASQRTLIPGIIGFAPATDAFYLNRIQTLARRAGSAPGVVNTLRLLYASLDTEPFFASHRAGRTPEAARTIRQVADGLSAAGADFLVVTSNTGSIILETADGGAPLPLLDVFETTMEAVVAAGFHAPGLISTHTTVASRRYERAAARLGARLVTPPDDVVGKLDRMIDGEAVRGIHSDAGRALLDDTVRMLADRGADSILLGCTDLILFGADTIGRGLLPVVDSSTAHADAAARHALTGILPVSGGALQAGAGAASAVAPLGL